MTAVTDDSTSGDYAITVRDANKRYGDFVVLQVFAESQDQGLSLTFRQAGDERPEALFPFGGFQRGLGRRGGAIASAWLVP